MDEDQPLGATLDGPSRGTSAKLDDGPNGTPRELENKRIRILEW